MKTCPVVICFWPSIDIASISTHQPAKNYKEKNKNYTYTHTFICTYVIVFVNKVNVIIHNPNTHTKNPDIKAEFLFRADSEVNNSRMFSNIAIFSNIRVFFLIGFVKK